MRGRNRSDALTRPLLILGTHDLAPVVAEIATDAGFSVQGFVENLDKARTQANLEGLPVVWFEDVSSDSETVAICGLGTTRRWRFVDQMRPRLDFVTVVHPSAQVSPSARLGEGTIVSPGVVISSRATLGRHVFVNRGALVGHDTSIGDYATVGPGANIAGRCTISSQAWIGIGAVILDGRTIGAASTVGAGAVVVDDVAERVTVMGVPARVFKTNVEAR